MKVTVKWLNLSFRIKCTQVTNNLTKITTRGDPKGFKALSHRINEVCIIYGNYYILLYKIKYKFSWLQVSLGKTVTWYCLCAPPTPVRMMRYVCQRMIPVFATVCLTTMVTNASSSMMSVFLDQGNTFYLRNIFT